MAEVTSIPEHLSSKEHGYFQQWQSDHLVQFHTKPKSVHQAMACSLALWQVSIISARENFLELLIWKHNASMWKGWRASEEATMEETAVFTLTLMPHFLCLRHSTCEGRKLYLFTIKQTAIANKPRITLGKEVAKTVFWICDTELTDKETKQ